jgi:hypothetical protein
VILRALLAGLMCLLATGAFADTSLRAVHGQVQVQRGALVLVAKPQMVLLEGDLLECFDEAEALVRFHDGAQMAVRPSSQVELSEVKLKGPVSRRQKTVKMLRGGLRYISGKSGGIHRVTFQTPSSSIGIRGTDIEIAVSEIPVNDDPAGTYLKVNTGVAVLEATNGETVDVNAGQLAFGGEPELVARGLGLPRRPAARQVAPSAGRVFRQGRLDSMLQ